MHHPSSVRCSTAACVANHALATQAFIITARQGIKLAGKEYGIRPPKYRLPTETHIGRVRLAVSDLVRSIDFYTRVIGLRVVERRGHLATLAAHTDATILLELELLPGVRPLGHGTRLGLYHTAFLLPSRESLSSFVRHLAALRELFSAGDHTVSEALYLVDPDGLTVEVYADRPRAAWTVEGEELVMGTAPVRFAELPTVAEGSWHGAPAGTRVGHVHFYVGELSAAAQFYHASLGLDITNWRFPGALFTAAGGYHHHVGLNTWAAGSAVASASDARLLFWELVLPALEDVEGAAASMTEAGYVRTETVARAAEFIDPWGLTVVLRS